jgi:predicted O-methyltransferase YrrM
MKDAIMSLRKEIHMTDKEVIGDLFQNMDEGKEFVSTDDNYVWFYLLGKYFKPRVIVEMGTRFGYSMKAFADGAAHRPEEFSLWSYDMECDGIKTLHVFEKYFRRNGVTDIHIFRKDTQAIQKLHLTNADLALVDGCHTGAGCYHECSLGYEALRQGGVMVVDDIEIDEAKEAVEKFCVEKALVPVYLPSFRGIYLVRKVTKCKDL